MLHLSNLSKTKYTVFPNDTLLKYISCFSCICYKKGDNEQSLKIKVQLYGRRGAGQGKVRKLDFSLSANHREIYQCKKESLLHIY